MGYGLSRLLPPAALRQRDGSAPGCPPNSSRYRSGFRFGFVVTCVVLRMAVASVAPRFTNSRHSHKSPVGGSVLALRGGPASGHSRITVRPSRSHFVARLNSGVRHCMTDPVALRTALAAFLGEERFSKFVRQGIKPRLKFWQEREWEAFAAANPNMQADLSDLVAALRICEVHGLELLPCTVETTEGCILLSQTYLQARAERFPHAAVDRIMVSAGTVQCMPAWYCPECRVQAAEWRAGRA